MPRLSKRRTPGVLPWLRVIQLMAQSGRDLRRHLGAYLQPHGVTDTGLLLLLTCSRAAACTQHELGASAGISPGQTSGLLDKLKRDGWVRCHRADGDRRVQSWSLTQTGVARLERLMADLAPLSDLLGTSIDDDQWTELVEHLERLVALPSTPSTSRPESRPGEAA